MNTSESALESWECILFIPKIFEVVEYSIEDPQVKMCGMAILANLGENTKCKADQRGRWVIADIFLLKEFDDDTFGKLTRWYPKWYPILKFGTQNPKIWFFSFDIFSNLKWTWKMNDAS